MQLRFSFFNIIFSKQNVLPDFATHGPTDSPGESFILEKENVFTSPAWKLFGRGDRADLENCVYLLKFFSYATEISGSFRINLLALSSKMLTPMLLLN